MESHSLAKVNCDNLGTFQIWHVGKFRAVRPTTLLIVAAAVATVAAAAAAPVEFFPFMPTGICFCI